MTDSKQRRMGGKDNQQKPTAPKEGRQIPRLQVAEHILTSRIRKSLLANRSI